MLVREVKDLPDLPGKVGFVPTMGALHEGHLSLVREARRESDTVVLSIFVNPLQFGPTEDFAAYPRNEARDIELAQAAGADTIFIPGAKHLTESIATSVRVKGVADLYEGERRPGHFEGVATIVLKLFHIVEPDNAYFGLKDRQQCAVIRRMAADLNLRLTLRFLPTVRERDGLALSSRNAYLSTNEREVAPLLYKVLRESRGRMANGENPEAVLGEGGNVLSQKGFVVDYFDLIDESLFRPTRTIGNTSVIVAAATLGTTRLIDNISLLGD